MNNRTPTSLPEVVDSMEVFPIVVDSTPMYTAMQQLNHELKDALSLEQEELAKVDHFEFVIRLIPEISVKVFPKNS